MSDLLTNAAEYSVSEISQAVKRTVEDSFDHVRIRGEISGFRGRHASGHAYFSLKDDAATIDAVVWKGTWPRLGFKPEEGLEIIATGRLTTFPRSSKYQVVVEQIEPAGAGALMALLEERRKRLAAEGLFARERKRPLPYLPAVIGVVTSPTGAVIRDILHRLKDRFPTHVVVWPVRVQGETCASEVSAAIAGFNALPENGPIARPDLLIVARGGGSIEDLWGFNEEAVVRAVAASAIPVISAVGHETDTTLIDHVADMRAPTPTAAAEAAVPVRAELIAYVDDLGARQRHGARRTLGTAADRLRAARAGLPRPSDLVTSQRQRLDHAGANLLSGLRHLVARDRMRLVRTGPLLSPGLLTRRAADEARHLGELSRRSDQALHLVSLRARARLDPTGQRLSPAAARAVGTRRQAYATIASGLSPRALRADLADAARRLDRAAERLAPATGAGLSRLVARLSAASGLLSSLSYRSVLARGFAIVKTQGGELVRSSDAVAPGDLLTIELAQGEVGASVVGAPPVRRKRIDRSRSDDPGGGQETLF